MINQFQVDEQFIPREQKITVIDFGSFDLNPRPIAYREHGYVVCPAEKRFVFIFPFLIRNRKKKFMIVFSFCMSVKFHHQLLNYMDLPVKCFRVSISLLEIFLNAKKLKKMQLPIGKRMSLTLMYLYSHRRRRSKPCERLLQLCNTKSGILLCTDGAARGLNCPIRFY